ncbi:ATP/GTP-binding protein [Larkinella sp. C7]|jgi:AAA15 family ATPase/GTPase|uniref:AAA family ATPase n=1 Tax=Larkinella sp. C7 TaxID=2576607 RepID=UPI0011110A48|nr:AAA family ATPase [Larkinella sp. C7]
MEKQHLTYFKIENFKRFDSFEMSNLGQFNLIVGDNNVGKTSVLEALTFDANDIFKHAINYYNSFSFRGTFELESKNITYQDIQQTDFWQFIYKDINKPVRIIIKGYEDFHLTFLLKPHRELDDDEKYLLKNGVINIVPDNWLIGTYDSDNYVIKDQSIMPAYFEGLSINLKPNEKNYLPYIPANIGYKGDVLDVYYKFYNSNKALRKELEREVSFFIVDLEEFRPHKLSSSHEVLGVSLKNDNTIRPLSMFGDGTVKATRIFLEIIVAQGHRLMIDEIGDGIHFSKLKDFWKAVINAHSKYSVQLFATTHSLECQQAFIEALQDDDMKQFQSDARNITMIEDTEGQVKAITYDFEQFEYAINIGFNTRGGKL